MKKINNFKVLTKAILVLLCFFELASCGNVKSNKPEEINNETVYEEKDSMSYEVKLFDDSYVHEINIWLSDEDYQDLLTRALEKNNYVGNVEIDGEKFNDVQVSTKGSSTLFGIVTNKLYSYSLKLKFKYGDVNNLYYGLDVLDLNNNFTDKSKLKDHIIYDIFNEAGVPAPLTSYTLVNVNGKEFGLYLALENINKSFLKRNGLNDAELYKPEGKFYEAFVNYKAFRMQESVDNGTLDEFINKYNSAFALMEEFIEEYGAKNNSNDSFGTYAGSDLTYTDDNPDSYSDIFDNSIKHCSDSDKKKVIKALKNLSELNVEEAIDTEEVIAYFAANNFVLNMDSFNNKHNFYLIEKDGLLQMLSWDNNFAMDPTFSYLAQFDEQGIYDIGIDDVMSVCLYDDNPMWRWIKSDEKWLNQYHDTMDKLLKEYFESGKCENEINRVNEMIRPYIEKDTSNLCTLEEYDKTVEWVLNFMKGRSESVRKQLDGELPTSSINIDSNN